MKSCQEIFESVVKISNSLFHVGLNLNNVAHKTDTDKDQKIFA